jgi:hypothetical protein
VPPHAALQQEDDRTLEDESQSAVKEAEHDSQVDQGIENPS